MSKDRQERMRNEHFMRHAAKEGTYLSAFCFQMISQPKRRLPLRSAWFVAIIELQIYCN